MLDSLSELSLITLNGLQSLGVGLVSVIEANFQLIDLSFKLFLNTKGFSLRTLLSFNGGSNRIHGTGMVFPCIVELIFFFSHTSIYFLFDLGKFKLSTQNLFSSISKVASASSKAACSSSFSVSN